jgi:hypothetical protein
MQVGGKLEMTSSCCDIRNLIDRSSSIWKRSADSSRRVIRLQVVLQAGSAVTKGGMSRPLGSEMRYTRRAGFVLWFCSRAQRTARPGKPRSACLCLCLSASARPAKASRAMGVG